MFSNKYIDIPYLDKGLTWEGCNCWGLIRLVLKTEANIEVPTYHDEYEHSSKWNEISAAVDKHKVEWDEVQIPQELDLAVIHCRALETHIGIMIDKKRMLHMLEGSNATVERLDSAIWVTRRKQFYRHKSLWN